MRDEILEYIKYEMLDGDPDIEYDTDLWEYIDSFSVVSLVLFLEVKYDFVVPKELITQVNFRSVDSIIKMINNGYERSESKDDSV